MAQFTVVQSKRVFRTPAKSIQHLTQAMKSLGMKWLAVHEDVDPTAENLAKKLNRR